MTTTIYDLVEEAQRDPVSMDLEKRREDLDARGWMAYIMWLVAVNRGVPDELFFSRLDRGRIPTQPFNDIATAFELADEALSTMARYGFEIVKSE